MVQTVNVTLDDFSPVIVYSPVGAWTDGSAADPFYQSYSDNGTFTVTSTNGASATLTFNGTAVWIYGAMRSNHGPYNVTLDGQLYQDTGFYNGDAFQQVLFSAKGLNSTRPHTVSIINSRTDPIRPYLDIDSIVYQIEIPDDDQEVKQQDTATNFQYSSSGWNTTPAYLASYDGNTGHSTSLGGAYADFVFEGNLKLLLPRPVVDPVAAVGSHVELYGVVGPSSGLYMVQLDGSSPVTFNASRTRFSPQEVLYQDSELGPGNHTMRITNAPFSGQTLSIDYAVIGQSAVGIDPPSLAPTSRRSSSLSAGVIGGIAAGASVFFILVAVLLFLWYRRRRRRKSVLLPQEVLHAEFAHSRDSGSAADSSAHLTPFRVFDSVIARHPAAPPPAPISLPPPRMDSSPTNTPSSFIQSPRQSEPGPSTGPRLVVYNADGLVTESTSLSDVLEEKRRLAIRERDRRIDPGPVPRLVSRIRNSAGQLPPDYHLATQPPVSRIR